MEEDEKPKENTGPVMEVRDQCLGKDHGIQPGQLQQYGIFQKPGDKTDRKGDPHEEIYQPFYFDPVHLIFPFPCSLILVCTVQQAEAIPFSPRRPTLPVMPYDPAQVYQPEADTFLLLEVVLAEVRPGDRVLEIGTGSGRVAAALVQDCDVVVTDINPHATFCAREKGLDAVRTNLFSGLRGRFDLILFNPPYLPTQPDERIDDWLEYALDGGATGRIVIERCAASIGDVLAPGGRILLLVSSLTGLSEVREIFAGRGFLAEVVRQQVVEDEELFVLRITRREI